MISAQSTPTNNGVQSIYFAEEGQGDCKISTHSLAKAAAFFACVDYLDAFGFNTQPRGGGCHATDFFCTGNGSFNTQPPEGGCVFRFIVNATNTLFQHTATRRWLPGYATLQAFQFTVSTHSHPKVAADEPVQIDKSFTVSTHSHPKVAAEKYLLCGV